MLPHADMPRARVFRLSVLSMWHPPRKVHLRNLVQFSERQTQRTSAVYMYSAFVRVSHFLRAAHPTHERSVLGTYLYEVQCF